MAKKLAKLAGRETAKRKPRNGFERRRSEALDPKRDFKEPVHAEQTSHEELLAENPNATMPSLIQNGLISVNYQKPHFEVDHDERSVSFEMSMELNKEHRKFLPKRVIEAWDDVESRGYKRIDVPNVPRQRAEMHLVPDDNEADLVEDAIIEKVAISAIEDKGTGETKDVIRLQFRLRFDLTDDIQRFACNHFGRNVWLKMQAVQGSLL